MASWLGSSYISRLSDHAGYHLVGVEDSVGVELQDRPRRVILIVIDGLREDQARGLAAVQQLSAAGQCRATDVGRYTVSRPVYAVMSTGLEADRTGARNNDETAPLAAESVWDVAAEAGLATGVVSHLSWWSQLFPGGFGRPVELPEQDDVFAAAPLDEVDLLVLHPVYVDHAGHASGAASQEYRREVARVDRELLPLLGRVDFRRDVVIFTADHGHSDAGGHGAEQPEVSNVLTCFAGRYISRQAPDAVIDGRLIAPTMAVLLGLRFPQHMRAGDDNLDEIWTIVDVQALPPAYVDDRRAAVQRFRGANAEQVADWTAVYDRERRGRRWAGLGAVALIAFAVGVAYRVRAMGARRTAASLGWLLAVAAITCAAWVVVRGSFDYTSINQRQPFIRASITICGVVALFGGAVHVRLWRDAPRFVADQATLVFVGLALAVAHIPVFGWPLGFPVPHRFLLFFPFIAAPFIAVHAVLCTAGAGWLALGNGNGNGNGNGGTLSSRRPARQRTGSARWGVRTPCRRRTR